ncbi:penicillin-binding protein 1C, partial [Burkholderia pseudomallei]
MNGLASTLARRAAQAAVPRWVWPFARPAGWSLGPVCGPVCGSVCGSVFGSVFGSAFGPAFAAFGLALAPLLAAHRSRAARHGSASCRPRRSSATQPACSSSR